MTLPRPGSFPPPPPQPDPAAGGRWFDQPASAQPVAAPAPAPAAPARVAPVVPQGPVPQGPIPQATVPQGPVPQGPIPQPQSQAEPALRVVSSAPNEPQADVQLTDWPPKPDPRRRKQLKKTSPLRSTIEWIAVIAGALLVAVLIRALFLQTFFIPSESMESTLKKNDRVLVNKLSYKVHDVHRGDVVVFKRPPGEQNREIKDLIKRVIGLPGETVEGRDGHVLIDGRVLTEPYLDTGKVTTDFKPTKIPSGMVFVMGDNRGNSEDSRFFGPIDQHLIVGRAFVKIWPFGRLGWL